MITCDVSNSAVEEGDKKHKPQQAERKANREQDIVQ